MPEAEGVATRNAFARSAVIALAGAVVMAACERGGSNGQAAPTVATGGSILLAGEPVHVTAGAAAGYVPDSACAQCHAAISRTYQDVAMAKSLYPPSADNVIEDFENNHYYHEPSNQHFQMVNDAGLYRLRRYQLNEAGREINAIEQRVDWIIGSGHHSRSYAYRNDAGEMYELPLAWYSQENAWAMAPGFDRPDHKGFLRPISRECLFCHNAYPEVPQDSDWFGSRHTFPEQLPHGIGCQRCHGPGAEHVRIADDADSSLRDIRGAIVNPVNLDPARRDDVCFQCHLEPSSAFTSVVRRIDRHDFSFRPGENLSDFLAVIDGEGDADRADRFHINHHPYRLRQSVCFTASQGAMSCLTCHDPHVRVPQAQAAAHYRAACFSCHSIDACAMDAMQDRAAMPDHLREVAFDDCTACHMPMRTPHDVVHTRMTDHKIQRFMPAPSELGPPEVESNHPYVGSRELYWRAEELPEPEAELLLAISAIQDGDNSSIPALAQHVAKLQPRQAGPYIFLGIKLAELGQHEDAITVLNQALGRNPGSEEVHVQLSASHRRLGRLDQAADHVNRALELAPQYPQAIAEAGLIASARGDHNRAIQRFQQAIELNPNQANFRIALANELAQLKRHEEAVRIYRDAIAADPRSTEAYLNLGYVLTYLGQWKEAVAAWRIGADLEPLDLRIAEELALIMLTHPDPGVENAAEALRISSDAANSESATANVHLVYALALLTNDRSREAIVAAETAMTNGADAVSGQWLMAIAAQRSGDAAAAQKYRTAAELLNSQAIAPSRLRPAILAIASAMFGDPKR